MCKLLGFDCGELLARANGGRLVGDDVERVGVQDDDRGCRVVAGGRDGIQVDLEERLTGLHLVALLDERGEVLAVELDRVEADVHQHLHTVWARDTDRVLRVEHRRHSARDGGDELTVSRADSDPLAEDLSREDGIVDLGERDDLTGEGALQLDAGGGGLCRVARVGDRTGEAKRSGGRVTPENERGDKRHTEGDDDADEGVDDADEGVDDVHRVLGVHEHRDAREARTDGDEGAHVCEAHVGTGAKGTHDDGDERPPVLQRDAVESRLGDAEERGDAGRERGRAEALVLGAERDAKGGA